MTRYPHTAEVYFYISAWEIAEGEVWKNSKPCTKNSKKP